MTVHEQIQELITRLGKSIIGLLANGNLLVEALPWYGYSVTEPDSCREPCRYYIH